MVAINRNKASFRNILSFLLSQKVPTFKLAVTLSNLNQISKELISHMWPIE